MDKNLILRYFKVFLFSLLLFAVTFIYVSYYHGYVSVSIGNKIIADVAILLLGIVLIIGPLTRVFNIFDHYILYRKEVGVVAFFFALLHGILSLRILSISYYLSHLNTFIPGISSLLILFILYVLSFEHIITHINRTTWWHIQNWGVRIGALLGLVHFIWMKYDSWINWYIHGGSAAILRSYLPSMGLLMGSFGLFILIVRISELFVSKKNGIIILCLSFLYIIFVGATFGWGMALKNNVSQITWTTCVTNRDSLIRESFPSVCVMPDGRSVAQIVRE